MADELEAALAWCDQPLMVVGDGELLNALAVARMHAANLAAEVRRLQAAHTMQVGLLEACEDLGVQLEAAKQREGTARIWAVKYEQAEAALSEANHDLLAEYEMSQQAEAAIAALNGQNCTSCQHRIDQSLAGYTDWCNVLETNCDRAGYRCGAWARREP